MVKPISDYTVYELSTKIKSIKEERERTANALKKYEEELEKRKQEVPLGVPISISSKGLFCVSGVNTPIAVKENYSIIAVLFDVLNLFSSEASAKKHAEMLLDWRKALVANAKGEPIDIKVLLPLLKKGWVAMDESGFWYWHKSKPSKGREDWRTKNDVAADLVAFNIKPAKDWQDSLMECGL